MTVVYVTDLPVPEALRRIALYDTCYGEYFTSQACQSKVLNISVLPGFANDIANSVLRSLSMERVENLAQTPDEVGVR